LWRRAANVAANHVLSAWTALVAMDLAVKAAFLAPGGSAGWCRMHASLFYVGRL
jgi:hypothetical protein